MKSSIIAFIALSTPLLAAQIQSKMLQIYPNASFLSYDYRVNSGEFSAKIPSFVDLKNLSLQSGCDVVKTSITKLENGTNKLLHKIKDLKNKKEALAQTYNTLKAKNELLKSIKLSANSLKNIKKDTNEFGKVYLENLKDMSKVQKDISKTDKEIAKLLKTDSTDVENELKATLSCVQEESLKLTFPLKNIKSEKVARFDANSEKNELKITQKLFLTHSFGNLLENVDIRLYSFAYNNSLKPLPFYPEYLQKRSSVSKKARYQSDMVTSTAPMMMEKSVSSRKNGVQNDLSTKRVWDVKNIFLRAGEENEIVFNTQSIKAEYRNFIDGYGSVKAYLKASFKPKSYVGKGLAKFVLDGALIGQRYENELIPKKETHVYFGQNSFIQIQKELLEKMADRSFFGTSQNRKILWQYIITNQSKKPQQISFHERLPISQDRDIKVKQMGNFKPDFTAKNGEVKWDFLLSGKHKKTFTFGYEVEKPVD